MLKQWTGELLICTSGRGLYECTEKAGKFVKQSGVSTGLLTLHLQHTSASLLIQENADPDVRSDLEKFFARLVPEGDRIYDHTAEGPDDMPAHVRSALTAVNLSIPISHGHMALGTWQGIYLWEHRSRGHQRKLLLHLIGEEK